MIQLNERFSYYTEFKDGLEGVEVTVWIYKDGLRWIHKDGYVKEPNLIERFVGITFKRKIKLLESSLIKEAQRLADQKLRVLETIEEL